MQVIICMNFMLQNIFYEIIFSFSLRSLFQILDARKTATKTSQDNIHVGGSCEGCEAIYESPIRLTH
jgi:hypothetical protein